MTQVDASIVLSLLLIECQERQNDICVTEWKALIKRLNEIVTENSSSYIDLYSVVMDYRESVNERQQECKQHRKEFSTDSISYHEN